MSRDADEFEFLPGSVIHANLVKLLGRRGVVVAVSLADYKQIQCQDLTIHYVVVEHVLVCFCQTHRGVGVGCVREVREMMNAHACKDAILVCSNLTSSAVAEIRKNVLEEDVYIVNITPATLSFDLCSHRSVPPHRLLSGREVKQLLAKYNLTMSQLASIHLDDPVVKHYGARVGDVFEIMRRRPNTMGAIAYRKVLGPCE